MTNEQEDAIEAAVADYEAKLARHTALHEALLAAEQMANDAAFKRQDAARKVGDLIREATGVDLVTSSPVVVVGRIAYGYRADHSTPEGSLFRREIA
jgi:hypothetical protein